jgi:hypothetical protein
MQSDYIDGKGGGGANKEPTVLETVTAQGIKLDS